MNPRGTFERVYDAIRHEVEAARFLPGDHLEPFHLADRFNSSVTPVRDALQRLVGERLIEATPGEGFRMPLFTEMALRQLYEWNGQLLQLALKKQEVAVDPGDWAGQSAHDDVSLAGRTSRLFAAIAGRNGNCELLIAIQSLNSRLSMVRCLEADLLANVHEELRGIENHLAQDELAALRRAVHSYHRRRQRIADRLVIAMQPS